ncbi:MAG: hypothetical protein JO029_14990, partial [Candidatus Eremiobacteraeota bacterium]|nr:hypothetical protein [Candidatus Eremiobacteraeota bacterium]
MKFLFQKFFVFIATILFIYPCAIGFAQTTGLSTVAGTGSAGFSGDGGAATAAQLNAPAGVAVDKSGNFYVADASNGRLRKVSGGTISSVGGTFQHPVDVAVDPTGNFVYIADPPANRVYELNVSAGTIATIAGTGTAGFDTQDLSNNAKINNPMGVATDSVGNLYIADTGNHRVRKILIYSGLIG